MTISSDLLVKLGNASPSTIEKVKLLLDGRMDVPKSVNVDIKCISISDAAEECGLSRSTIYRLIECGKIATVKLASGTPRIVHGSLVDYMLGGNH